MSSQSQGSRLAQIQMRYQQKQMQENAQKKSEMFDETQKLLTSSLGAGKVRAMFDEKRRQKKTAGIDKSYLLEPIVVDTNKIAATTMKKRANGPTKPSRAIDQRVNYSKVIVPPLQNRLINHDINGNNHFSSSNDPLDKTFRESSRITTNNGGKVTPSLGNNEKINSTTAAMMMRKPATVNSQPTNANSSSVDVSPLKNVTNQNQKSPTKSVPSSNSSSARSMVSSKSISSGQSRTQSTVINNNIVKKSTPLPEKSSQNSYDEDVDEKETVDDTPVPEGLVRCPVCKRNFAEDRIEKHQVICQKSKIKKRKVFDTSKKRVQGTEAESYARKPTSAARAKAPAKPAAAKNSAWRAKHEDFIRTVRAAKEMQIHLAKGGKLSDLPPPPPSENPDYVQCPHCNRRFNSSSAERHIPLCKNMQHNKPKAKPTNVGAGGKGVSSQMKRR